jgi:hypothetical protein
LDRNGQLIAGGELVHDAFKVSLIEFKPGWYATLFDGFERHYNGFERATSFANLDDVTTLDQVRGNIDLPAVDHEMSMTDKLARLGAGAGKTQTIYDGIESLLEEEQKVFPGNPLTPVCSGKIAAELPFENTINAFNLLLLA